MPAMKMQKKKGWIRTSNVLPYLLNCRPNSKRINAAWHKTGIGERWCHMLFHSDYEPINIEDKLGLNELKFNVSIRPIHTYTMCGNCLAMTTTTRPNTECTSLNRRAFRFWPGDPSLECKWNVCGDSKGFKAVLYR